MNQESCPERYTLYPSIASDTFCVGDRPDTLRIIGRMKGESWRDRTQARMRQLKLTQQDLTKVFQVDTRGAVGHYLKGRRQPSPDQLIALGKRMGMSMDELLLGDPPSQPARLNAGRLADLIETIDTSISMSKKDMPVATRARMTAKLTVSLYEQGVAAAAVQSILASLLNSMEEV